MISKRSTIQTFVGIFFYLGGVAWASAEEANFLLSSQAAYPPAQTLAIESVHAQPVLQRGAKGSWDGVDALNPSVIRFKGKFYNYYSGYDGKVWHTGLATSSDGTVWDKYPGNPILSPDGKSWDVSYISANGAAIEWKGRILYFYQGVDKDGLTHVGLAVSSDGLHFEKMPKPVLSAGIPHSWESRAASDPYVIARNGTLYMYYIGLDDVGFQRLGVAKSADGLVWEKSIANPIMDVGAYGTFDENGLGEPSVIFASPYFYMIYTGRSREERRNLGYAVSLDGIHWKKMSLQGVVTPEQRGAWASQVVCDSTFLPLGGGKWIGWFGGGNKAEPAENLEGQIGLMTISVAAMPSEGFDAAANWSGLGFRSTDVLKGSYPVEDGRDAWVGPVASVEIGVPSDLGERKLVLRGWLPASLVAKALKSEPNSEISIIINGKTLATQRSAADEIISLSIPGEVIKSAIGDADSFEVQLKANRSFVPAKSGLGPDLRELSFKVNSIRLE